MRTDWNGKPYHSLDFSLREKFGKKVYKLALDGGMTCPNRDGTLGRGGCIFCSRGGSGDFAERRRGSIKEQVEAAKKLVAKKVPKDASYIAYFQSYTNTYAPVSYLEPLFREALSLPEICGLSVATRPDCLPGETVALLSALAKEYPLESKGEFSSGAAGQKCGLLSTKPVWVELGLQTIHEETAAFIRRGYALPVFEDALKNLHEAGLLTVVHVILGLPGESREEMLKTVEYLSGIQRAEGSIEGIKLQLLHVLKDTDLETLFLKGDYRPLTLEEYLSLIGDCLKILPQDLVIHRLTGDGPKKLLLAPLWSADKRLVLNSMAAYLKENGILQGMDAEER